MAGKYDDLDVGGLQLKCNEKTDETLESTRRMMQMCGEAKQVFILNSEILQLYVRLERKP